MRLRRFSGLSQSSSNARRLANTPARRLFKNARSIPAALGADDHVGIIAERYALRMLLGFQFDLDIVEIRKHELAGAHALEATLLPHLEKTLLRVRVQNAVAFLAAEIDRCVEDSPRQA